MQRLAVIADTHLRKGSPLLPEKCVVLLASSDIVIHAGDLADTQALELLRSIGPPVVAVCGNVDNAQLASVLPRVEHVTVGDLMIGVIHDAGPSRGRLERMRRLFPAAAAVVFGHSHIPFHEVGPDGFQLFNPGSPTVRRRQPRHTMGLGSVVDGRISFEHILLD